ncbi:MAG: hypothetical protein ABI977_27285 [Acidobacteriota bacterium]
MNALAFVHQNAPSDVKTQTAGGRVLAKAQVIGTVVGLAGGLAAGISGSIMTVASWLTANEGARHWLHTAGTSLFFLTIPLIILGACCLDWIEKDKPQGRSRAACYDDDDDEQ